MSWLHAARARWQLLVARRRADARIESEFDFHIALETERLVREQRLDPAEAKRQALVAFGGRARHRDDLRVDRGFAWFPGLALDLRLGARMLRKYPGLSLVSVVGMGMAVAVSTVMFTSFEIATRPVIPLPDGDRIVGIRIWDRRANRDAPVTIGDFQTYRDALASIEELGAFRMLERNLVLPDGDGEPVFTAEMTASAFRVAGVAPLLGRTVVEADEHVGAPPVLVLSHQLWQRRFAGDPAVVGQHVRVGDVEHTIVGVMPMGFAFPLAQEAWTPLRPDPLDPRSGAGIRIVGRLADRATRRTAQAELSAVGQRLMVGDSLSRSLIEPRIVALPALVDLLVEADASEQRAIPGLFSLLLVVVCIDVATLIYARTATRQGEIAIRASLGASRRRIVAQLFTEALVLSSVASLAGLAAAQVAIRVVLAVLEASGAMIPFWIQPRLSLGVVVYVVGLTLLAAIIVGILPARHAAGAGVRATLSQLSGGASVRLGRAWTVLIVAQVGIAVAVLPGVVTLSAVYGWHAYVAPGFAAEEYLTARIEVDAPPARSVTAPTAGEILARLESRLEGEPGVTGVTFSWGPPGQELLERIELDLPAADTTLRRVRSVRSSAITTDFLSTFGVRVIAGRDFGAGDLEPGARSVLVNETFVREVLGGRSAIGRRLRAAGEGNNRSVAGHVDARRTIDPASEVERQASWKEIIGVVADFPPNRMSAELTEARMYEPMTLGVDQTVVVLSARSTSPPAALGARLRSLAIAVDPRIRVDRIFPLDELYRQGSRRLDRLAAFGMALITLSVLVLSAAGMYALMSFTVTRQRREIGIRSALGANPRRLLASVFARAMRQLGLGGAVGLIAAATLDRVSGGEFLGGHGGIVLPSVLMLIGATGVLAALGPARRGLRIAPSDALKSE